MYLKVNKFFLLTDNFCMKTPFFAKILFPKTNAMHCGKFFFLVIGMIFIQSGLFSEIYKEKAVASFYADDFHGKKTSNGEIFNMNDFTCANKFLPFNTYLKVTNLANNLNVIVRVNDRGPFVEDRELDLSKAAAVKLDMVKSGTASVKIEIVKLGPDSALSRQTAQSACQIMERKTGKKIQIPSFERFVDEKNVKEEKTESSKKQNEYPAGTFWDIQTGSYSNKENARKAAKKLQQKGFSDIVLRTKGEITRVVIKNIPANKVPIIEKKLKENGYSDFLVKKSSQK